MASHQDAKNKAAEIKDIYEEFLAELKALRSRQKEEMHGLIQKLVERKLREINQKIKTL